jgi:hypothetical protein
MAMAHSLLASRLSSDQQSLLGCGIMHDAYASCILHRGRLIQPTTVNDSLERTNTLCPGQALLRHVSYGAADQQLRIRVQAAAAVQTVVVQVCVLRVCVITMLLIYPQHQHHRIM